MSNKFSLTDLLSDKSLEQNNGVKAAFEIELIDIDSLRSNPKNIYEVDDVQDLIDSISFVGLEQNLKVRKDPENSSYIITSGHRRLKALRYFVDNGREEFRMIPCKVSRDAGPVAELYEELRLIHGNSTARRLSEYEQTQQMIRMKELLKSLEDNGVKIPGRLQTLIAEILNTSKSKVGRMENIANNLAPEFQKEFKSGSINISVANELSGLPQEQQRDTYIQYKEKGSLTVNEVKQRKNNSQADQPSAPPPKADPPPVPVSAAVDLPIEDDVTACDSEQGKKLRVCANCGTIIAGEWYKCLDNFLQFNYFQFPDERDNIFCSQECFCSSLSLEIMDGDA